MKRATRRNNGEAPLFAVDDHLRVQMQIEERAYELWRTRGSREDGALDNWVQAEGEVLEKFLQSYGKRQRKILISSKIVEG